MNRTPLLRLDSVSKRFGAVRALTEVSFDLRVGEVHALLGENGAGKSTLIRIITGAHAPDSGTLAISGSPVTRLTPRAAHALGIACIYQQPALFPDLTVAENIALRLEPNTAARRVRWATRHSIAAELLARLGADFGPEAEVRTLAMPAQQLVEIACALGAGARIVIMDEPTASLTRKEQQLLFSVVRGLRASGVGIIYISHRLEEIFSLADRVTVLRDGRTVGTGPLRNTEAEVRAGPDETPPTGGFTADELIQLMVGREVSNLFPKPSRPPGEPLLALNKVGCKFGGVRNVSFEVRAGEIVGLAGLVGAGRTELARILFGITPGDSGEVQLHGQPIQIGSPQEAVTHGIAYVPEDRRRHGVILDLPISQNVTMAIHKKIFPGTWLQDEAERELTLDFIRKLSIKASGPEDLVSSLSGGNQQKVAVARWLATEPRLLILDEPTQGVDVGAKHEIHRIIRGLADEGLAVLMISSDLPEILGLSDRIVVMRGGTVAAELPGGSEAQDVMAAALGKAAVGERP